MQNIVVVDFSNPCDRYAVERAIRISHEELSMFQAKADDYGITVMDIFNGAVVSRQTKNKEATYPVVVRALIQRLKQEGQVLRCDIIDFPSQ